MTGKERLIAALDRKPTDRLPATTHHVLDYFMDTYMDGRHYLDFFRDMKLDPIFWVDDWKQAQQYDDWRIEKEVLPDSQYFTERLYIHTPVKTLQMLIQSNPYTSWVSEPLIKDKKDIEILERYMPAPVANKQMIQNASAEHPDCLIRGTVACLSPLGQPGTWQELTMLYGVEDSIIETYDDPEWVEEALTVIRNKKIQYVDSLEGCPFDVLELGGGSASTTVISPGIFEEFVAPYDAAIIEKMHERGQRVVYHTCGGMMPILEQLAEMKPNALETFTPIGMGGDVDLAEAKKRIGDKVCMIGGFDQGHHLFGCSKDETRKQVRKCFEAAGEGGGFILSPSDHFFDVDLELVKVFADEAANCIY